MPYTACPGERRCSEPSPLVNARAQLPRWAPLLSVAVPCCMPQTCPKGGLRTPPRLPCRMPAVVYLLCGLTGSGKTTYARRLEAGGAVRLSVDELPMAGNGEARNLLLQPRRRPVVPICLGPRRFRRPGSAVVAWFSLGLDGQLGVSGFGVRAHGRRIPSSFAQAPGWKRQHPSVQPRGTGRCCRWG
jgi:hypothetical protein